MEKTPCNVVIVNKVKNVMVTGNEFLRSLTILLVACEIHTKTKL